MKMQTLISVVVMTTVLITCVQSINSSRSVDPCVYEEPGEWADLQTFASIKVNPQDALARKQHQCITTCIVKPVGHFQVNLNVVFQKTEVEKKVNSLEYQYVKTEGDGEVTSLWSALSKPNTSLPIGVKEYRIRFRLTDLSTVSQLCISFADQSKTFSISCQFNHLQKGKQTGALNTGQILAAVFGCVISVAIIVLVAVALIRYRMHRHVIGNAAQKSTPHGTVAPERSVSGQTRQSEVYVELDDCADDSYYNAATPTASYHYPTVSTAKTDAASLEETQNELSENSAQNPQMPCQQNSKDLYSKPHIYMNPTEHPYAPLNSGSQRPIMTSTLHETYSNRNSQQPASALYERYQVPK